MVVYQPMVRVTLHQGSFYNWFTDAKFDNYRRNDEIDRFLPCLTQFRHWNRLRVEDCSQFFTRFGLESVPWMKPRYECNIFPVFKCLHVSLYVMKETFQRKILLAPNLDKKVQVERLLRLPASDAAVSAHLNVRLAHGHSVVEDTLSFMVACILGDSVSRVADFH
jgi:hypothetical protein